MYDDDKNIYLFVLYLTLNYFVILTLIANYLFIFLDPIFDDATYFIYQFTLGSSFQYVSHCLILSYTILLILFEVGLVDLF